MPFSAFAIAAALTIGAPPASAQLPVAGHAPQARLKVFLDCFFCFADFIRTEVTWVDFVRQREDAHVHVLSSQNETGGGGREVVLRFIGLGPFESIDFDLKAVTTTGDTEDARRRAVLRAMTVGFLSYLARDGRAGDIDLTVRASATGPAAPVPGRDPWRAWVFSLNGGGAIDASATNREWNWEFRASADRVTDAWKVTLGVNLDENHERFDLDDEEQLDVVRLERRVRAFAAKSAGPHWSFGLSAGAESSTFGNTRFSARASPAVEFSVFPYTEYASRQMLLQYAIGVAHARYKEITLFDKLEETHPQHELSLRLTQRQPWGSLEGRAEWSQYLHDLARYRLEVNGDISWRLARGLSWRVEASASRIHDQLSLPRRDATPEEVLLRLRELQSSFRYQFETSLTFSFGSIFNNVVNPRFGR